MLRFSKKHNYDGLLICVEGIDGSGKSTQIELLYNWLKSKGIDTILTQWNSSELISNTTKKAKKKNLLSGRTFSLLHAVDFADRQERTIKPDLTFYFDVTSKESLERICSNRQPKFYEAGMDMKLSNNPYKSYVLFQNRILEQYKEMVDEFGLIQIDALDSIHQKQKFIRQRVCDLLNKHNIKIEL